MSRLKHSYRFLSLTLVAIVGVRANSASADPQSEVTRYTADTSMLSPDSAAEIASTGPTLSAAELKAVQARLLQVRESTALANSARETGTAAPGLPQVKGTETTIGAAAEVVNPQNLVIGRNNRNTNANNAALGSTLAEPAAANNAMRVFAAGNFNHAEVSANGGVAWANVPLPGGPADAPIYCCDNDVLIDDARRFFFHSGLYINNAATNGVVRIFVRRPDTSLACSYTIDPAGAANNILPDYPHIGITKRFLYLTINAVGAGAPGSFARIYRFNIDQMTNCVATATQTFTQQGSQFGQRVWVPAEGTNNFEAMYWVQHDNPTTIRIFTWLEANAGPTATTRGVQASNFVNTGADCRGGVGNFNWVSGTTAMGIFGFRHRSAFAPGANNGDGIYAVYWNSAPIGGFTQAHVRAAVFSLTGLALLAQPHIFNNAFCFAYPVVTANKRGDLGISIAFGGRAGGGGNAAQSGIGIDDEFTTGLGVFGTITTTATGTHNRSDGRFGDYFTIHPYEPCEKWFTATNYALLNGTGVANVNSRYIEFGRNQSLACWRSHFNQLPTL